MSRQRFRRWVYDNAFTIAWLAFMFILTWTLELLAAYGIVGVG